MCGRFASRVLKKASRELGIPISDYIRERFNIAPTAEVSIIRRPGVPVEEARWQLVPAWFKDASWSASTHNAKVETVAELASFRTPWKKAQRCLIPATGFYEWIKAEKRPFYFSATDGEELMMAGLWDHNHQAGRDLLSCTILVGPAGPPVAAVHDRQAVILPDEALSAWLDPKIPSEDFRALLGPCDPARLQSWEVSQAVNKTGTEGAHLIEPLAAASGR